MNNIHYLSHHGIKGMKWGVRRYQNKDGRLTNEGRKRRQLRNNVIRNLGTTDAVNEIVRSMSDEEKKKLRTSLNEEWIEPEFEIDILSTKAKTIIEKYNDVPVAFVEVWTNGGKRGEIAIGTRAGEEYRGKGYATAAMNRMNKYLERYGKMYIDDVVWKPRSDNIASKKLAEKFGFKYQYTEKDGDYDYDYYLKKLK